MHHLRAITLPSLFSLALVAAGAAQAQQPIRPCDTNKNSPPVGYWHWPAGTQVRVFLMKDMFTGPQQQAILEVMQDWNRISRQIGTGITYTYAGETDRIVSADWELTLTRSHIKKDSNNKYYAYFYPRRDPLTGLLLSGWITFDFRTTETAALKGYMAHELAHSMGLWDCESCKGSTTIMNRFPHINKNNGLVTPSPCDIQVMREVFTGRRNIQANVTRQPSQTATVNNGN